MKDFTKIITLLISGGLISLAVNAQEYAPSSQGNLQNGQNYYIAIGTRVGSGLTVKDFINPSTALEGILSFGYNTLLVTGLVEKHFPLASSQGFKWFFGLGSHVGFFRYRGFYYWAYEVGNRVFYVPSDTDKTVTVAGIDMILGLDYKFKNAPFNIGIDAKPFIDFYNGANEFFDGALSVRFAF